MRMRDSGTDPRQQWHLCNRDSSGSHSTSMHAHWGGNTHLRSATVALGATICRLQVMSGFGQTGHRADEAELPSLT